MNANAAEAFSSEVRLLPQRERPHHSPQTPKDDQRAVKIRQNETNFDVRGGRGRMVEEGDFVAFVSAFTSSFSGEVPSIFV